MELFYIPKVMHSEAILEGEELHHATRVLRKKAGDHIEFTDGLGSRFSGVISELAKREARIEIEAQVSESRPTYQVEVATALTKNIKRMEWAFEKMTEIGVAGISPITCHRSERTRLNDPRMQKILVSAMKQSERYTLPRLNDMMRFEEFLDSARIEHKYIAHRSDKSVDIATHYETGSDVLFLIGPEGDFTDQELVMARDAGFIQVNLGQARLRTETAGLFAVSCIHALNMK